MLYRKNQRNGEDLSQLGYGCMRFPRKGLGVDIARSAEIVHSSIERGMNYFDTAYIYPGSEDALGKILAGGWREKVNIATKMPLFLVRSTSDFDKFFTEQLKRLQTGYIDYYMLHMLTDFNYFDKLRALGIEGWLKKEKERGRIKNIGFSFHGRYDEFERIIDAYDWEFCMIQYNYLDENYQAGAAGLKYAYAKNIPVIAMEPLRGGTLAVKLPEAVMREFNAADIADKKRTPAGWALRWLWNQPEVAVVLSGMSSEEQVAENIAAACEAQVDMMTDEELQVIEKVKRIMLANIKVHCTGCNYCLPCPFGVDIPSAFSRYNEGAMVGKLNTRVSYIMTAGILSQSPQFASQCKKCGKCEPLCPQNIEIMRELDNAKKYLEPFWAKPAAKIARRFTIGGVKK
jgi:predicted aldo/keto reductase-like oxidoreductase